jgi:hypothetical protein
MVFDWKGLLKKKLSSTFLERTDFNHKAIALKNNFSKKLSQNLEANN